MCLIFPFCQQPYMLSAIRGMSVKRDSQSHAATAEYLEACNKIFEKGILSHSKITHTKSHILINMHSATFDSGINTSKKHVLVISV